MSRVEYGGKALSSDPGIDRRGVLVGLAALMGVAAATQSVMTLRDAGELDVVAVHPTFGRKLATLRLERLHTGTLWGEGPAWNALGRYLVWSDMTGKEELRFLHEDGHVARRFRSPTGGTIGNTFDFQGRQISCEGEGRRVVRYEHDGSTTVLASGFEGKPLKTPNDVVVRPEDRSIWFTDLGDRMRKPREGDGRDAGSADLAAKGAIYRIDAQTGATAQVSDALFKPNGLCFSPDGRVLYVANMGPPHGPEGTSGIWAFDVAGAKLENPRLFASVAWNGRTGSPDGLRCDEDGAVWAAVGWGGAGYDGAHVFSPDGERIGVIRPPEAPTNLCFGGPERNRLFMTTKRSLYAVHVGTRGAHIA